MIDRVFVLCTGRCGSQTLATACGHMTNWSAGHETRNDRIGAGRLDYPAGHIEVDNRLSWHLGQLAARFDDETTLYVHLRRDPEAVARSYVRRFYVRAGIMHAFGAGIIRGRREVPQRDRLAVARQYVATVEANIDEFMAHRANTLVMDIENPHGWFDRLWDRIGATGDREAAHETLGRVHNASKR